MELVSAPTHSLDLRPVQLVWRLDLRVSEGAAQVITGFPPGRSLACSGPPCPGFWSGSSIGSPIDGAPTKAGTSRRSGDLPDRLEAPFDARLARLLARDYVCQDMTTSLGCSEGLPLGIVDRYIFKDVI